MWTGTKDARDRRPHFHRIFSRCSKSRRDRRHHKLHKRHPIFSGIVKLRHRVPVDDIRDPEQQKEMALLLMTTVKLIDMPKNTRTLLCGSSTLTHCRGSLAHVPRIQDVFFGHNHVDQVSSSRSFHRGYTLRAGTPRFSELATDERRFAGCTNSSFS